MDRKQLLTTLSMLALTLGGAAVPAQAQTSNVQAMFDNLQCEPQTGKTEEECACGLALRENTIEALEEFLRRYPPDSSNPNSCLALAALQQFTIAEDEQDDRPPPGPLPY